MSDSFSLFPTAFGDLNSSNVKVECETMIISAGSSYTFNPGTDFIAATLHIFSPTNVSIHSMMPSSIVTIPNMQNQTSWQYAIYLGYVADTNPQMVGTYDFQDSNIHVAALNVNMVCAFIVYREAA